MLPLKNYDDLRELTDDNFCPIKDSPQQNSRTIIVEIITNIFRSALVNFP